MSELEDCCVDSSWAFKVCKLRDCEERVEERLGGNTTSLVPSKLADSVCFQINLFLTRSCINLFSTSPLVRSGYVYPDITRGLVFLNNCRN